MLSKKLAAIDKTRCVACGVCENTCPLGAVKVRRGMAAQEHPEMSGNSVSRMWRKHRLKKQYQKKAREAA